LCSKGVCVEAERDVKCEGRVAQLTFLSPWVLESFDRLRTSFAQDKVREGSRFVYNEILRFGPKKQTSGTTDNADCADKRSTSRGVDSIRVIRVIRGQEEAACFSLKRSAPAGQGPRMTVSPAEALGNTAQRRYLTKRPDAAPVSCNAVIRSARRPGGGP